MGKNRGSNVWYLVRTENDTTGWIAASVGEPVGITSIDNIGEAATIPVPPPTFTSTPTNTPEPTETPALSPDRDDDNIEQENRPKPKSTPTPPL